MTIKIIGLLLMFGFFLISPQGIAAAKPQNPATPQSNKNQEQKKEKSIVATSVQELLSVADRNGGIGESVRVIAQKQNDSEKEVTEKVNVIEKRNKIKTFLIGSDYKNLGALRSEMVKTSNRIDQLKRLVDKNINTEDKTVLQNQITTLEQEQTKINDFITQNESKFSLFGWVSKLFTKKP